MVTRNFYEIEDVVATMLWAIQTSNTQLAGQALNELLESGEQTLAQKALALAWWLTDPSNCMEYQRYMAFQKADPVQCLCALLADNAAFVLPEPMPASTIAPPSVNKDTSTISTSIAWSKIPLQWTPTQASRLWKAIQYALKTNFHSRATDLVRPLLASNRLSVISLLKALGVSSVITDTLATTVYLPLAERILGHAMACISCDPCVNAIASYEQSKGRSFAIPPLALASWNRQTKPQSRLIGNPILVAEPTASKFWKEQIANHKCTVKNNQLQFPTDELCESFYSNTNFPQDIPDEWSLRERAKSHGLMVPSSTANPWQVAFLQCWA